MFSNLLCHIMIIIIEKYNSIIVILQPNFILLAERDNCVRKYDSI